MSACCTFYRQVISNSCSWFPIQVVLCNLLLFFALSFFTCLAPLSSSFSSDISPPGNFPKLHPMSHTLLSCPWNSPLEASVCHVWLHKVFENKDLFLMIISYLSLYLHAWLVVSAQLYLLTWTEEWEESGVQWGQQGSWVSQAPAVSSESRRRSFLYRNFVQLNSIVPHRTPTPLLIFFWSSNLL